MTPFENALAGGPNQGYFTPEKEAKRQAVNHWIRTGGAYDGLIDFESEPGRTVFRVLLPIASEEDMSA